MDVTQTPQMVAMTEAAADVVQKLLQEKNIPDHALRVFVTGGGCSGMQYGMAFEKEPRLGDSVTEINGVTVLIDPQSANYLSGAQIDYVDSLMGGGFRIDNPNSAGSCGCGHSFRAADTNSASAGAGAAGGGCGAAGCGV